MKRKIIKIDEELCNGCGQCSDGCPEGAIQMIDGKARLVAENFCDGLGACIGTCPVGAITVEEREAEVYDERKVIERIATQGKAVVRAHLKHLKDHNEMGYFNTALQYLSEKNLEIPNLEDAPAHKIHSGCPGSQAMDFKNSLENIQYSDNGKRKSELTQWPVQLHLLSPYAEYFQGADVLLAADCTAYALGDFHKDFLKGKRLAIACPKLDNGLNEYKEKLVAMINEAKINTLTVLIMQVPCCRGLLAIATEAVKESERKIPVKCVVVGIKGEILKDEWVTA